MPSAERPRKRPERIGRVDWRRVRATTDQDIARQIAEDPDAAPALTEDALDRAVIVAPGGERTPYRQRVPRFSELFRPGTRAPKSGQYEIVGPQGQRLGALDGPQHQSSILPGFRPARQRTQHSAGSA